MQCGQRSSGAPYGTGWADDEGDDDGGGGSSGQLESRRREPEGKGQAPATKTRQEQEVGRVAESKARQGKARQAACVCVMQALRSGAVQVWCGSNLHHVLFRTLARDGAGCLWRVGAKVR